MTEAEFRALVARGLGAVADWEADWRSFERDGALDVPAAQAHAVIDELGVRLRDNYPYFHPDYAAQMLRPPHPVALAAYAMAMRINPNNHALDGGPATAALEREAIAQLATMCGYPADALGHLTTSGTIANLEALWVATRLLPGTAVAVSSQAHYTHARMCELLGARCLEVATTADGAMDPAALRALARKERIGTIVAMIGATACGAVDPLHEIADIAHECGARVHADAAYGGFFRLLADVPEARLDAPRWHALARADSIAVDPHKHGLQPYGCGCVLFKDPNVARLYAHDSPYTYFTSAREIGHLGEISLECSRPGAAAAALWATLRCVPLNAEGLGRALLRCRGAALHAEGRMRSSGRLTPVVAPALDIVTAACMGDGERVSASELSRRAEEAFAALMSDRSRPFYVATWRVPRALGELALPSVVWDAPHALVLRSVLMKPEHAQIVEALVDRMAVAW